MHQLRGAVLNGEMRRRCKDRNRSQHRGADLAKGANLLRLARALTLLTSWIKKVKNQGVKIAMEKSRQAKGGKKANLREKTKIQTTRKAMVGQLGKSFER